MNLSSQKIDAYKNGMGWLGEQLPKPVEAYHAFTGECLKDGLMTGSQKHLIALGISLFANNEICTFYHTSEALDQGASPAEVMETVAVAAAIGGGYVMSQGVTRVQQALEERGAAVQ